MIVISGALVLVALVLLIFGLVAGSLGLVYASIGASLAAFAFLVIGVLQRRGAVPSVGLPHHDAGAGAEGAGFPTTADEIAAAIRTPQTHAVTAEELGARATTTVAGEVLVVAGRPRYHVAGCRYLTGRSPEPVDVARAREDGFTPCGVCKPDEALATAAPAEPVAEEVTADVPVAVAVKASTPRTAKAPAKAAAKAVQATPVKAAKAAPVKGSVAVATKTVATKTVAAKAPAKKAAAAKPGVVIIPDRDKFHTPECRYVRTAAGTQTITKPTARARGYQACGVCNP